MRTAQLTERWLHTNVRTQSSYMMRSMAYTEHVLQGMASVSRLIHPISETLQTRKAQVRRITQLGSPARKRGSGRHQ